MPKTNEIPLANAQHTVYSDEPWFLIVDPESGSVQLEGRFQSDAPDRTGFPSWATTNFCVSKSKEEAVCRVSFASATELLAAERNSVVPETIWEKAVEHCRTINTKQ